MVAEHGARPQTMKGLHIEYILERLVTVKKLENKHAEISRFQ